MSKPVLFCFDGSDGSRTALTAAAEWITPAAIQLARAGSFVVAIPNEGEVDEQEAASAKQIAEDGAAAARKRGYNAVARVAQAGESVVRTIEEIADEIDAGLILCGQRGRGALGSALLGSVSHALAAHTKRPVLIAPQHPS
jgi:nucleotide-binding universal stress UspA family protein